MKEIFLPESLEFIRANLFAGSTIMKVTVPASVVRLENGAFAECRWLKEIAFQPGSRLELIGEGCFYNSGLEAIALPPGVRELMAEAFKYCESLTSVTFAEDS